MELFSERKVELETNREHNGSSLKRSVLLGSKNILAGDSPEVLLIFIVLMNEKFKKSRLFFFF